MTQIETAKKILEQGNCVGIKCEDCPFDGDCGCGDTNIHSELFTSKVEQWLKEQENNMVDLTKNQIVEPMVEAWFWDNDKQDARKCNLVSIDHRLQFPYRTINGGVYSNCSLTDPNKPKVKKWETIMDVPACLWGRALVKKKTQAVNFADIMEPSGTTFIDGRMDHDMHYLPLGQPLDGEWLEFESEVIK